MFLEISVAPVALLEKRRRPQRPISNDGVVRLRSNPYEWQEKLAVRVFDVRSQVRDLHRTFDGIDFARKPALGDSDERENRGAPLQNASCVAAVVSIQAKGPCVDAE